MKKVIKPAEQEESVYYSDFSGKLLSPNYHPPVVLKMDFNYGSKCDGTSIELHLDDEDSKYIIDFIKQKISQEYIDKCKKELEQTEFDLGQAAEFRDWSSCEYISNKISFLNQILKS